MADRRLHVLVEGQTELVLAQNVFEPYLEENGWLARSFLVTTKRPVCGPAHRGGVTSWAKLHTDIKRHLADPSLDRVTTMIDYYRFPADGPGMATRPSGDPYRAVAHVERALADAVGDPRFVPHLTLHEAETWVFAAAAQLGEWYDDPDLAARLRADCDRAGGPELVNDGPQTAPSKRLLGYRPTYLKTEDGPAAIAALGVPALRDRCPHVDRWLVDLFRASRA